MKYASDSTGTRIRLAAPDLGEEELEAVRRVFASGILTNGTETLAFESSYAARHGAAHGVAFSSGTAALAAVLLGLGIGPGDDVIVPSFTFISTATSVLHVGANAVFADIDPETFNIDPADVARRITPTTKAIVAVHYGGQSADMDELRAIADEAGAVLLEDAAEAHGATYKDRPVGNLGRAGMFSFTPTKNITTGEGGLITTDDEALAERLRLLRNHGQTGRYQHDILGYNWRLTEMQAAIGCAQLAKLDGILERKRTSAGILTDLLDGVDGVRTPIVRADRDHVFMLYTVILERGNRDQVLESLLADDIEARLYFPPAHRQPVFAPVRDELPVTDWVAEHALSLPVHAGLTEDELREIAKRLTEAVGD